MKTLINLSIRLNDNYYYARTSEYTQKLKTQHLKQDIAHYGFLKF